MFRHSHYLNGRGHLISLWGLNYPSLACIPEVLTPSRFSEIDSPDIYLFFHHVHFHFSQWEEEKDEVTHTAFFSPHLVILMRFLRILLTSNKIMNWGILADMGVVS